MYLVSAIHISTQCPVHHDKNVHYLYPPHPYPSWYGPYTTCHNINRVLGECWPYKKIGQQSDFPEKSEIWLTYWPRGRTEFEEMLSHQDRNNFRNPSSTKWSLYTVLFFLSVSLAPKMLKQNFMLESLRPEYTISTFQSRPQRWSIFQGDGMVNAFF